MKDVDPVTSAESCLRLLMSASQAHSERTNKWHSLLKTRYALYDNPFDLELFDIELSAYLKDPSSSQSTYANVTQGSDSATRSNSTSNKPSKYLRCLQALGSVTDKVSMSVLTKRLHSDTVTRHACGLLEVEPLHFVVASTSDGARVERLESAPSGSPAAPVVGPPLLSANVNFGEPPIAPQHLKDLYSNFVKKFHPLNLSSYKTVYDGVTVFILEFY